MEIGLKALAVFCSQLTSHTTWSTHNRGNREIAATGVAKHPHVVGDLIERQKQETHVHAFHDWPQARHGCANSHARETIFSNRRVEHTQLAVFLVEILCDLVRAAVLTDVFTHHANVGVAGHLLVDGLTKCVEEKSPCHGVAAIPAKPA